MQGFDIKANCIKYPAVTLFVLSVENKDIIDRQNYKTNKVISLAD